MARPVEEADVLVGQEDVDEAAQLRRVVEQALGEARVGGVEGLRTSPTVAPSTVDLAGAAGQGAQLGGDADGSRSSGAPLVDGGWAGRVTARGRRPEHRRRRPRGWGRW